MTADPADTDPAAPTAADHSTAVENYAKAIFTLQASGQAVRTTDLAERLEVRPASVSTMLTRLEVSGLVAREPYHGVRLTDDGERVALAVIRRHRLLELFLAEALQLPWDVVHIEAERLEHHVSPIVEAAIAAHLGDPTHDPHGDPIPTAELELPALAGGISLAEVPDGATAELLQVSDRDPAMLRYLAERGILPGASLKLVGREPFGGPLRVESADELHLLGEPLARAMTVRLG
ncbi:MAG: metal-dependent transcriptional regulator [Solirubrobacteraceae bacterium]|nr:metal-dependent transcriptional regulator [Solirubrobacteraceae bacterium]